MVSTDENIPSEGASPVAQVADSQEPPWLTVHPLTPVMRSWASIATILALITVRSEDAIRSFTGRLLHADDGSTQQSALGHVSTRVALLGSAALLAFLALLLLLNWIAWRATSYRVTDVSVEIRKGVLFKQHRNARLDRVQAIDVLQPFVPRLFGLAELSFDVAGSGASHLRVSMLKRAEAETLRDSMLTRAREARLNRTADDESATATAGPDPAAALSGRSSPTIYRTLGDRLVATLAREGVSVSDDLTQTLNSTFAAYDARPQLGSGGQIVHVPPHRVVLAGLLRMSTVVGLAWLLFGIGVFVTGIATGNAGAGGTIAITSCFTAVGFLHNNIRSALKQANFSAALTPDGLLITQGVTSTERRLVPLDRIQAVGLEQPLLWRPFGWWRAHYNIATHGHLETSLESSVLLPVGPPDDALAMLALALPLGPDGEPDHELDGVLLRDAMASSPERLHGQPRSSRWIDPLSWRVNGWWRTPSVTLMRRGRIKRRVECIPHARIQSLGLHAGPVQRALGLGTVHLHSTSGPLSGMLPRQAGDEARTTLFDLAEIARDARLAEQARGAMTRR